MLGAAAIAAIACSDLSFSWPDGSPVLSGLTVSFGPGRTGLIGVNGSGKSTLLRLIAGDLRPASGTVRASGEVGYLPQAITLGTRRTRVGPARHYPAQVRTARHRGGPVEEQFFAAVSDDWDVEERARAWLDRLGLASLDLDDQVAQLSGGETVLVALAALFLRRPAVLLLDEPTNNLDLASVRQLAQALEGYRGAIIVASHDLPFLRSIGITRWLGLDRDIGLTVTEPL